MPSSLESLNLGEYSNNTNKFAGGIPAEWSSMTNLKRLYMRDCGLVGGSWSLQMYSRAEAN